MVHSLLRLRASFAGHRPRRRHALALVAALAAGAAAAYDPYAYGAGTRDVLVTEASTVVNASFALAEAADAGATQVRLEALAEDLVGRLLLLHQTQVPSPSLIEPPSDAGPAAPLPAGNRELADTTAGRYWLRRIVAQDDSRLSLDAPLDAALEVPGAQAVVVFEARTLTISQDAGVRTQPWDGRRGGVVALLVDGLVRNDGTIDASAAGYRGAPSAFLGGGDAACLRQAHGWTTEGCAPKGEGFEGGALGRFGGPAAWAGGGGGAGGYDGHAGGGGGGGAHGGAGGRAALTSGGQGSAALGYGLVGRLLFGGGGGSGHVWQLATAGGGTGGGAIFVRARRLEGSGSVRADGVAGADALPVRSGSGGGGAGGAIALFLQEPPQCGGVSATGGAGGALRNDSYLRNPGGGGAGGRVLAGPPGGSCPVTVANGLGGAHPSVPDDHRGAEPTSVDVEHSGTVEYALVAESADTGRSDAGVALPRARDLAVGCGCEALDAGACLKGLLGLSALTALLSRRRTGARR